MCPYKREARRQLLEDLGYWLAAGLLMACAILTVALLLAWQG